MNRREFISLSGLAGAGAAAGCASMPSGAKPEPAFVWGELIHLGMNEWHEIPQRQKWPNMTFLLTISPDAHYQSVVDVISTIGENRNPETNIRGICIPQKIM